MTALSLLLVIGLVAVLLATFTDLEAMIVPDRLSLPVAAVALAGMMFLAEDGGALRSLAVWAIGLPAALHLVGVAALRLGLRRPIGGGDVKLLVGVLALTSAVAGGPGAVMAIAVLSAGCIATLGLVTGRLQRGDRLPFAPAIALGFAVVVLAPDAAAHLIRSLVGTA
jgi:leader peptidase (prepilin peptidase) / N-methyltransferase